MTAPKRVLLSFFCLLLGFTLFALIGLVPTAIGYGARHTLPVFQILPVYLLFALPGVVLALPFTLFFKNADGYRAWVILAIGTCIGPAFLGTWSFLANPGHFSWRASGSALAMAVAIGFPTTVFYVVLLKRFSRRALSG